MQNKLKKFYSKSLFENDELILEQIKNNNCFKFQLVCHNQIVI